MSKFEWYCCTKCAIVAEYAVFDDGTTSFPRGEFLGHNDYIITGIPTKQEAQDWLEWHQGNKQGESPSERKRRLFREETHK